MKSISLVPYVVPLSLVFMLMSSDCSCHALTFMSDLPTPSVVVDMDALHKRLGTSFPSIPLPNHKELVLTPQKADDYTSSSLPTNVQETQSHPGGHKTLDVLFDTSHNKELAAANSGGAPCYGYLHTRVVKSKSDKYLAELDLPSSCAAHLVLGLNNHHVISYYWARSAGAGASMEAPGIVLQKSRLLWESKDGFTACNSNDGKRSEWVNFLRVGDQVQLRPDDLEASIVLLADSVYGVSSEGRPLGAEPLVACKFELVDNSSC